jgi:carboxylesterase type B
VNVTQGYQSVLGAANTPTWEYRFDHVMSFDCWGPSYTFCLGIVCHGSDLPFVFNVFTDGVSLYYEPTADETKLASDLGNAWTNFITSRNPNSGLAIPLTYPTYE